MDSRTPGRTTKDELETSNFGKMVNHRILWIGLGAALIGTLALFGIGELICWWVNHQSINMRSLKWWE